MALMVNTCTGGMIWYLVFLSGNQTPISLLIILNNTNLSFESKKLINVTLISNVDTTPAKNIDKLTHWSRDKMANFSQTIFSKPFIAV